MVHVNPDGQNILFWAFAFVEVVGALVLAFRTNAKGREYLRRLPPVGGVKVRFHWGGKMFDNEPVRRAFGQRQSDPELERLRRESWRRGRFVFLWMFGFPILVFGVLALLILSGLVIFTS